MSAADLDDIKERLAAEVDQRAEVLIDVSHQIHAHPELCFEERFAHDLLTTVLEQEGLPVERQAYGLDTAFAAAAGSAGPTIAVFCEYDALPELGHACGHNIIAAAGLGAGLAAAQLAEELGGRVLILGSPAEEGGGGKILMGEKGAYEGVDAAMMVHPANADLWSMTTLAIQQLHVDYFGQAAHAAAFPYKGRNALDAAVLGYVNVAALRQHIQPSERIHGIFTRAGDKPNIVPEHTAAHWYVRSSSSASLQALKARVLGCLEAGAAAAGCRMEHAWKDPAYADLVDSAALVELYTSNAARTGRAVLGPESGWEVVGSTDMGNVSYLVPSIHPMIQVAPPEISIHSAAFAEYAAGPEGDRAVVDGAKAMAMTIADLWLRPEFLDRARRDFATIEASPSTAD